MDVQSAAAFRKRERRERREVERERLSLFLLSHLSCVSLVQCSVLAELPRGIDVITSRRCFFSAE